MRRNSLKSIVVGVSVFGLTLGALTAMSVGGARAATGAQYCASAKAELDKLNVYLAQSKKALTAAAGNPAKLKISMPPLIAQYRKTVANLESSAPADLKAPITVYLETLMNALVVYEKVGFDAKKITPAMLPDPKKNPEYRAAVTKVAAFIKNTCKADPVAVLGSGALS